MDGGAISAPTRYSLMTRVYTLGLLTVLWLMCVLMKKSLGAMFCLLEIRRLDVGVPTLSQMVARSAPVYALSVLWVLPFGLLPVWGLAPWLLFLLLMIVAILVSGIVGIVTGSSLLDRFSKTVVLQLKLPDHAKPRIFGIRII